MAGEIVEIAKKLREIVDRLEALTKQPDQPEAIANDPLAAEMDVAEAEWRGDMKKQAELQAKVAAQQATEDEKRELSYMPYRITHKEEHITDICFQQHARRSVTTDTEGYRVLLEMFTTTTNLRYLATVRNPDAVRRKRIEKERSAGEQAIARDTELLKKKAGVDAQAVVDSFFAWLKDKTTEQQLSAFRAGAAGTP